MDEKRLAKIEDRLTHLEQAVFGTESSRKKDTARKGFAGLKGGLRLLLSRGFFASKRTLSATKLELEKNGYHYSAAAIQTTLNRLSTRSGPLAAFKEAGKKVYVTRK